MQVNVNGKLCQTGISVLTVNQLCDNSVFHTVPVTIAVCCLFQTTTGGGSVGVQIIYIVALRLVISIFFLLFRFNCILFKSCLFCCKKRELAKE